MVGAHRRHSSMAVRAADLALADLGVDRGDAASVPRELRHGCALWPDVVELENHRIALPAIGARAPAEHVQYVSHVPRGVRIHVRPSRRARCRIAPPPASTCGPPAVAVRADDLATCDLGVDRRPRRPVGDQLRDAGHLLPDVVELQHDGITLAAVDARRVAKVVEHVLAQGLHPHDLGSVRLLAVQVAPRSEVRGEARSAPPLSTLAKPVEALRRELVATSPATAQLAGSPHWEPSGSKRLQRLAERRPGRRRRLAHPNADRGLSHPELSGDARERPAVAPQPHCLPPRLILPSHEHMFAARADGNRDLDCSEQAPMV